LRAPLNSQQLAIKAESEGIYLTQDLMSDQDSSTSSTAGEKVKYEVVLKEKKTE